MRGLRLATMKDWENPSLLGINKLPPHVPLRSHNGAASALSYFTDARRCVTNIVMLSSLPWRFKVFDRPEDVPEDFMSPQFSGADDWAQVQEYCRQPRRCLH